MFDTAAHPPRRASPPPTARRALARSRARGRQRPEGKARGRWEGATPGEDVGWGPTHETSTALYEMQVGARILAAQMAQEDPEEAFLREFGPQTIARPQGPGQPTFDARTERLINGLRADLQPLARQHISTLRQTGTDARVVQGTRTWAQQARIYAQGRTTPGPQVKDARPGQSAHNFGAAYDIGIFENGAYSGHSPLYRSIGPAAAPPGVVWGPTIPSFPQDDVGHYQLPNWQTLPPIP